MRITRKSQVTGEVHTLDLNVTVEQVANFERGVLVQDAFPDIGPAEREFILSGITPEEWHTHLGVPPDYEFLCLKCGEEFYEVDNETHQQWQCPACGSWNDKKEETP